MASRSQFTTTNQSPTPVGTPSFRSFSQADGSILSRSSKTLLEKPEEDDFPRSEIHQEVIKFCNGFLVHFIWCFPINTESRSILEKQQFWKTGMDIIVQFEIWFYLTFQ